MANEELLAHIEDVVLRDNRIFIFKGPPCRTVGDVPYFTLTSYGIKPEGECIVPDNVEPARTEKDAVDRFEQELLYLLKSKKPSQLAWRRLPELRTETETEQRESQEIFGGNFEISGPRCWVSARLALLCCDVAEPVL